MVDGEATPSQIAGFAVALRMKGETPEEIAGLAEVMRDGGHARRRRARRRRRGRHRRRRRRHLQHQHHERAGRGLGRRHAWPSTATAASPAHAAPPISWKRSAWPSICRPTGVARCVDETGFGFMFAPLYHPAMRHAIVHAARDRRAHGLQHPRAADQPGRRAAPVDRRGGGRPGRDAGAACWTCSAPSTRWSSTARTASTRSRSRAPTQIHEVRGGEVRSYVIEPEQFGLAALGRPTPCAAARSKPTCAWRAGARRRARCRRATWCCSTPARRCTWLAWPKSIEAGIARAADELDSGRARDKVDQVAAGVAAHQSRPGAGGSGVILDEILAHKRRRGRRAQAALGRSPTLRATREPRSTAAAAAVSRRRYVNPACRSSPRSNASRPRAASCGRAHRRPTWLASTPPTARRRCRC